MSRLGQRFAVLVVGLSSLFTLLFTCVQFAFDYQQSLGQVEERLAQVGLMSSPGLSDSLWQIDTPQIDLQLQGIVRLPELVYAAVKRPDGTVVASAGAVPTGEVRRRVVALTHADGASSEHIGDLELTASMGSMLLRLYRRFGIILLGNAVKTFFVSFFIMFLAHILIIQRLNRLTDAVHRFGDGREAQAVLDRRLWPVPADDEITALFAAVSVMSDKRAAIERSLRNAEAARRQEALRAEAANAAKTAFLCNVSHELRTPLAAILGFSELIADSLPEDTRSAISFVPRITRAAQHLLRLVDDLLIAATAEVGGVKLRRRRCDLVEICRYCCELQQLEAGKSCVRIDLQAPAVALVDADPERITQIVHNLLSNAIKFSAKASVVSVTIRLEPAAYANNAAPQAGTLPAGLAVVSVSDHGIGIAASDHEAIFTLFGRVDSSTSTPYRGTGLGLTIAQHLAKLHGSEIRLSSKLGEGSTFYFSLPLVG